MTRPLRPIRPSAGQPSVPRERLREAARAVARDLVGPGSERAAALVAEWYLASKLPRRRRVALAMRQRTERPNPTHARRCLQGRRRIPLGESVIAPVVRGPDGRRACPGELHARCAPAWYREHDA
jgi:hypothetical protein